ncbi:MAG: DUF2461 domain-containing protein [Bacteroidales bacterium]|nr:DUF2461 domain-containing protein [Bacteroidales bacterium]
MAEMQETLEFLRALQMNNNREWFHANKAWYDRVQAQWNSFCEALLAEMGKVDASLASLTVKDCTYRIYRDTRFSTDKSPYKTHFGVFICPGGKRSMHAGYYFHVSVGGDEGYPHAHMLASGNYCYDKEAVRVIREDISDDWERFQREVLLVADARFVPDMEGALKRVPHEFSADAPYADWMRMKSFCLNLWLDDDFILSPNLLSRVVALFQTTKPFVDFVNRAVDYVHEL